jgi:MFS family permease
VCCAFTLDSSTTGQYEVFAVSYFEDHARLLGVINTVEAIINAVSKPFVAKVADMTSRQTAYMLLLVLYVVGYIIIATAQNGVALAVGRIIGTVGQAGLDLVTDIIVADLTPLEWRGFFTALTSLPFIWFAWIGPEISGPILRASTSGWRWGFGMFGIM